MREEKNFWTEVLEQARGDASGGWSHQEHGTLCLLIGKKTIYVVTKNGGKGNIVGGPCRKSLMAASISLMKQEGKSSSKNEDGGVGGRELGKEEKI